MRNRTQKTYLNLEKIQLFAVARSITGVSVEEFAAQHDVGRRAIYQALQNPKTSKRLVAAIDEFISKHCPKNLAGNRPTLSRRVA